MLLKHVPDSYGHIHVVITLREGLRAVTAVYARCTASTGSVSDLTRELGMCILTLS